MLITPEYRDLNLTLHRDRPDYGSHGHRHAEGIRNICLSWGITSLLDYGCGKGTLIEALRVPWARGYDPCMPGLDGEPQPADMVVCTDVLEHVEPDCVESVFDHLRSLSKRLLFVGIATRPAAKTLPDGRNTHLTVQPAAWWLWRLLARWEPLTIQSNGKELIGVFMTAGQTIPEKGAVVNVRP